jgi:hypothetical protein
MSCFWLCLCLGPRSCCPITEGLTPIYTDDTDLRVGNGKDKDEMPGSPLRRALRLRDSDRDDESCFRSCFFDLVFKSRSGVNLAKAGLVSWMVQMGPP